jgi:hypothetical protein
MRLLIAVVVACAFGAAYSQDCQAAFDQYKQCHRNLRQAHQGQQDSRHQAIDKCLSDAGCNQGGGANEGKFEQCHKDLQAAVKPKIEQCVQGQGFPNFHIEENLNDGKRGGGFREVGKKCGGDKEKSKKVFQCIKTASPPQSEDQNRQRFNDNCSKKKACDDALKSANCQAKFDQLRQAICKCNQQTDRAALISSTPSCSGKKTPQGGKQHQKDCSSLPKISDACQQGYDAWKASHGKKQGGGHKGGQKQG